MLLDIDTAVGEARALHANNQGYFAIFRKTPGPGVKQQSIYQMSDLDEVVSCIATSPDVYLSQSAFKYKSRKTSALGQLGCAYVDIDCYKLGIEPSEQLASDLMDKAAFNGLPLPSYIISSGRGLYLKWLFTDAVSAVNLVRWNALQNTLISLYHAIGADMAARDASRVLRVVGSTNSSAGGASVGPVWVGGQRYSFDDLSHAAAGVDLPEIKISTAIEIRKHQARIKKLEQADPTTAVELAMQRRAVVDHLNNYATQREPFMLTGMGLQQLNWRRFVDLRDLSIARGGVQRGSRDLTLFWMGVFLAHSGIVTADNFEAEMSELSSGFPGSDFKPMQDGSLSTLLDKVRAKQRGEKVVFEGQVYNSLYTPTNDKLIDIFEITPEEQVNLCTIINSDEKMARADAKAPGRVERREQRARWRFEAEFIAGQAKLEGHAPNITAIAAKVGVHKTQVSRLLAGKIGCPRKQRASSPKPHHQAHPSILLKPVVPPVQHKHRHSDDEQASPTAFSKVDSEWTPTISRTVFKPNPFKVRKSVPFVAQAPTARPPLKIGFLFNPKNSEHLPHTLLPSSVAEFAVSRGELREAGVSYPEEGIQGGIAGRPQINNKCIPNTCDIAPPTPSVEVQWLGAQAAQGSGQDRIDPAPKAFQWPRRRRPANGQPSSRAVPAPSPVHIEAPAQVLHSTPPDVKPSPSPLDINRLRDRAIAITNAIRAEAAASSEVERQLRQAEHDQRILKTLNQLERIRVLAAQKAAASPDESEPQVVSDAPQRTSPWRPRQN